MRNKMLKTKIKDKEVEYSVDYRNVKYIRYELRDGKLRLILPKRYDGNVEQCVHRKEKWIYNKLIEYEEFQNNLKKTTKNKNLTHRTLPELKKITNYYIEKYQNLLNVKVNRLQFRDMNTKWGSCSSLNNITLSKDLRFIPENLIAYIIYHELAHIIVLAHNDEFYKIIQKEYPNYKNYDDQLNEYWFLIKENT